MYHFIFGVHVFLSVVALLYMGIILLEQASEVSKYLLMATVSNFFVILGYTMELMGTERTFSLTSVKLQLIGLIFLITFLLFFISKCCESEIPRKYRILLLLLDAVILLFAVTCDLHPFYFTSVDYVSEGFYYPHIIVKDGIVCYISLVYSILQGGLFVVFCMMNYQKSKSKAPTPASLLSMCFLPTVIALLFFYTMTPEKMGFNPVPASIAVGMSYLVFMVYKYRLLNTTQVAKDNIIASVGEIFFVVDVSKKLLFANYLAYDRLPQLRDPKKREALIQEVYRNKGKSMEMSGRQYQVSVSPFYDKGTLKGYSLWLFDKTDEIENTKRLIELKNQAEEANHAKTVFLANMSHEIRTPLNAIMGSTEMILRSDPKPELESHATDIKKSGKLLLGILSGILDFSKIESGQTELVEINYDTGSYLKEVVKQFFPRMQEKGLSFPVYVDPGLPRGLRGDAIQIRQVITNLLDNACKYTQSGFVSLAIHGEELADKVERLTFVVEDTGCGIKEHAIPTLFDSFQREDLRKNLGIQGTGLGLAIAKRLVEGMGGEISVESTYGSGTKFSFWINQKITDPAPIGDFEKVKIRSNSEKEEGEDFIAPEARVLCVDDNETNRKVIKDLMSIYRLQVDVASGGEECLKLLASGKRYHIIFMDQMMPEMDGIETAEKIRNMPGEIRRTPIIALTANAVVGAREMFLEKGFQDYLSKPIELEELKTILLTFLPEKTICYIEDYENPGEFGKAIVLPGVDTKAGLARFKNERVKYLQALKYFYDDGEKQLAKMRGMVDQRDPQALSFEVHALKGLAIGIGANSLGEKAENLETAAKEGDMATIIKDSPKLFEEYELLIANIRFVLIENEMDIGEEEADTANRPELAEEEFKACLMKIRSDLEMLNETGAEEGVKELLSTKMNKLKRNLLLKAKEQILDFEYEEAIKNIDLLLT